MLSILQINPPEEISAIHTSEIREENIIVSPDSEKTLKASGTSLEIKMELEGGNRSACGVKVFCSPDGREETVISYEPLKKNITINFIKSSVNGPVMMPANAIFGKPVDGFPEKVSAKKVQAWKMAQTNSY
ncbi:MAG: GH32 C-terminal domain-containing protein [Agriterribacter sp.]